MNDLSLDISKSELVDVIEYALLNDPEVEAVVITLDQQSKLVVNTERSPWRSIKDVEPPLGECLVLSENLSGRTRTEVATWQYSREYRENVFISNCDISKTLSDVTHWMPIPDLPRG